MVTIQSVHQKEDLKTIEYRPLLHENKVRDRAQTGENRLPMGRCAQVFHGCQLYQQTKEVLA